MQKQEITKYQAKEVFKEFKDDTHEVLMTMLNNDNKAIRYVEVCDGDQQDGKKTEEKVKEIFKQIKKIFNYLQVKSKRFPVVDNFTLFEYFIKPTEILSKTGYKKHDLEIILLESQYESKDHRSVGGLNRAQFIEFLCRLSKYMYTSNTEDRRVSFRRDNNAEPMPDRPYDKSNY